MPFPLVIAGGIGLGEFLAGTAFVGSAVGAGVVVGNAMSQSNTTPPSSTSQDQAKEGAGATPQAPAKPLCSTCKPPRDPCQGLRDQIAAHQQKLADYTANPYAHDNKNFLGQGRDQQIIDARTASLQKQIQNFQKQLEECEKKNGTS